MQDDKKNPVVGGNPISTGYPTNHANEKAEPLKNSTGSKLNEGTPTQVSRVAPKNTNPLIACLKLEGLGYAQIIRWQDSSDGTSLCRYAKGDLLATLLLRKNRLEIAFSSASDLNIPAQIPDGAALVVKALRDCGVVFTAKPHALEEQP